MDVWVESRMTPGVWYYRTGKYVPLALYQLAGTWQCTIYEFPQSFIQLPHCANLEEAQATALAVWRTSS